MTREQKAAIRRAYLDGSPPAAIAAAAGVSEQEADVYLTWWCSQGCPGAIRQDDGSYRDETP